VVEALACVVAVAHPRAKQFHAAALALLVLGVFAPCAAANIPATVIKTNPVRFTPAGNQPDGTLTTTVTYTDTDATATASTAYTILLQPGSFFRLRTCVAYHLNGQTPVSRCAERTVDTTSNTTTVNAYAPRITLRGQPRPTTQPWGYFTPYTEVQSLNGTSWQLRAHSWPVSGLQGAGIAVAPQNQDSGTLPPNSTVTLDGAFTGAIDTGQPDSICTPAPVPSDGSPLPAGVSTSDPAFPGAPAYYEVGLPRGHYEGQPPRGVMLVIHGGTWISTGVGAVQSMRADADRWRGRGWETVNLTYRPCGQSLTDVLWFYDRARASFSPGTRICALGTSAGGHLALLVGASRQDLYCAISQAGPTDLRVIQGEGAYDPASGTNSQTLGGRLVHNTAAAAFGEENLPTYSPAAQVSPTLLSTRVLQGFSADDGFVPYQQANDLADAMHAADPAAFVESIQLAAGTIPFGHGGVTRPALTGYYARERLLAEPLGVAEPAAAE
jgi:acetyl esterase/lipase